MATSKKEEAAVKTVNMDDGTIVEFAGKRKMLKTSTVDEAAGTVKTRLDFVNGEVRFFSIPQSLLLKFAAHGAEQKLGDEIAGVDDVEDCILAVDSLLDRLHKGEWSQKRDNNGLSGTSILARALAESSKKPMEQIRAFLGKLSQAEKMALRNNPSIKPIVDRLEAEKQSAKKVQVDTEALLQGLTGDAS